jgi:hypothetical protein
MIHLNCFKRFGKTMVMILILSISLPAKSQTTPDGNAPQFLYPGFTSGTVIMKNGKSQIIDLNYNTISEKIVYQKDGKIFDLINTEMVDTILLHKSKFVPVGKVFYEILLVAPISLFVQYKGDLVPPGTPAGYGSTSQVSPTKSMTSFQLSSGYFNLKLPDDFQVKVNAVYWIRKENTINSFLNERQFVKNFPGKEAELKKFIKENHIRFEKPDNLVVLVQYCNEMLK